MSGRYANLGYFQAALGNIGHKVDLYEDRSEDLTENAMLEDRVKPRPTAEKPISADELLAHVRATSGKNDGDIDSIISRIFNPLMQDIEIANNNPFTTLKRPDVFAESYLPNGCSLKYEHFPSGAETITLGTRDRGVTDYTLRFDGEGELVELRTGAAMPAEENRLHDKQYLVDFFVRFGKRFAGQYHSALSIGHDTDLIYSRSA